MPSWRTCGVHDALSAAWRVAPPPALRTRLPLQTSSHHDRQNQSWCAPCSIRSLLPFRTARAVWTALRPVSAQLPPWMISTSTHRLRTVATRLRPPQRPTRSLSCDCSRKGKWLGPSLPGSFRRASRTASYTHSRLGKKNETHPATARDCRCAGPAPAGDARSVQLGETSASPITTTSAAQNSIFSVKVSADLQADYVLRLQTFRPLLHFKFHRLTLVEGLVALGLDRGEMHEHIFARLALDKPIALGRVEPLHRTLLSAHGNCS